MCLPSGNSRHGCDAHILFLIRLYFAFECPWFFLHTTHCFSVGYGACKYFIPFLCSSLCPPCGFCHREEMPDFHKIQLICSSFYGPQFECQSKKCFLDPQRGNPLSLELFVNCVSVEDWDPPWVNFSSKMWILGCGSLFCFANYYNFISSWLMSMELLHQHLKRPPLLHCIASVSPSHTSWAHLCGWLT